MSPRFKRDELRRRYDVATIDEDSWHAYSGCQTQKLLRAHLSVPCARSNWLLNAGAGIYELDIAGWTEICLDLFLAPIKNRTRAVCASVEALPFRDQSFGAIACVGEVLGYCDLSQTFTEFARALIPQGVLICDFGNSCSFRYLLKQSYGRTADMVVDSYNGMPERTWIYDPQYVKSVLVSAGFNIVKCAGTHTWSALARRLGAPMRFAIFIQRCLAWLPLPSALADVTTIVAVRNEVLTR